jgi:HTH-type transcriptional regulator / antitoxin HigA
MASRSDLAFAPDYAVPPGETLVETLEALEITQAELARRTDRPTKTISEIANGKAAITPDTALQFERVLGVPASFWINRESQYQEALARQAERKRLSDEVDVVDKFPVRNMVKLGWIRKRDTKVGLLDELLNFFGVASPERLSGLVQGTADAVFRKSLAFPSDPGAVAAWLRQGEIKSRSIECESYDENTFRSALSDARALTREPADVIQEELPQVCARAGVAVAFVPELPGLSAWGATRWVSTRRALIQLSLRYKTDDHLWFTFFHESGHVLLHPKKRIFLEWKADDGQMEEEANRFASDFLIPSRKLRAFVQGGTYRSKASIETFAARVGISPGIVVGRLQHEGHLPRSYCNALKRRFRWAHEQ